ncbi:MAG: DUF370 domain-containing protein [Lachnospiraceae bacterium]
MFINIGYGNYVNSDQIISISRYDSAPIKRLVISAKDKNIAIDATQGRKTKSVIMTSGGYVILSALLPDTISGRYQGENHHNHIEKDIEQDIEQEDTVTALPQEDGKDG